MKEKGEAVNISIGNKVKILSKRFGAAYAKGRDKFTHGVVKGIKEKSTRCSGRETRRP